MRRALPNEKENIVAIIIDAIEVNPKIQYFLGTREFPERFVNWPNLFMPSPIEEKPSTFQTMEKDC